MARPITLFTGQWADLPFEEVCRLASEWGYDGLEVACWGDHLDVVRAAEDASYAQGRRDLLEKYGLGLWAISNHLGGPLVCDDPLAEPPRGIASPRGWLGCGDRVDERPGGIAPRRVWGGGDPEGVRRRAAEERKATARAAKAL